MSDATRPSVTEIAPGVFIAGVATPEYDVRGALVIGRTHALVWDTLTHPRDMAPFASMIADRHLVIAYSHADWDHVWGTAGLPWDGAQIVGHERCLARFSGDVPGTLASKRAAEPGAWDDVRLLPPTRAFSTTLAIDLGGVTVEMHHLPGHTEDCLVGFVNGPGVLLAGDTVETPLPVVPCEAPLHGWIAQLRAWAADARVRIVVPAHGRIGGVEVAHATVEYLQALADGAPIVPSGPLDPFYADTHRDNLGWRGPSRRA